MSLNIDSKGTAYLSLAWQPNDAATFGFQDMTHLVCAEDMNADLSPLPIKAVAIMIINWLRGSGINTAAIDEGDLLDGETVPQHLHRVVETANSELLVIEDPLNAGARIIHPGKPMKITVRYSMEP